MILIDKYFKDPEHHITINVIGVGGTGSLIIPRLARMDYALKKLEHPGLMVNAYDHDVVEEGNIGRQNFSDCDEGKNKAMAIIEKCNLAYGLLWEAHPRKFEMTDNAANITIICVDNVEFRKIYHFYKPNKDQTIPSRIFYAPFFTFDCGNGKNFGQVIVSGQNKLKNPFQLFPDMMNQDNEEIQGIAGCSYADSLEKQDLFINDKIAIECCDMIWGLFRKEELEFNGKIVNSEKGKVLPVLIQ